MFRNLKLNHDNIETVITEYAMNNYKEYSVDKQKKSSILTRFNLALDDKRFFLDIFLNNRGDTTIQVTNGTEQEEKVELAKYISSHPSCMLAKKDENNRSVIYKNINIDDFKAVIDLIKSGDNFGWVLQDRDDAIQIISQLQGKWKDKVTITFYKSTSNVRIQGRPLLLFNEASSYFNELLDEELVVDTLEATYNQNLSKSKIEMQYEKYLPNSYDKHSPKLKKSLIKAVYNTNIESQEYMCTELTFEVLRALEGHIKLTLFNDFKIASPNKFGTLTMFSYDLKTEISYLKDPQRSIVGDPHIIDYYERAYKHYCVHRHNIFHWDYPDGLSVDETEQIFDAKVAKSIIIDVLKLIDEYYA